MMDRITRFEYRIVKNGEAIHLPKLYDNIEICFPNHQQFISDTLIKYDMQNWRIVFEPYRKNYFGTIAPGINLIVLAFHRRKEMIITLYHEIIHYLHPEWKYSKYNEKRIDRLAVSLYRMIEDR